MNSNIRFDSNVYPVIEGVNTDNTFLSKIWDYNRIVALDKRYSGTIHWPSLQKKILLEEPFCSLNKEDPCWGMVKNKNGYTWVSMCTKSECKLFKNCRSGRPYDPVREAGFVPTKDNVDREYGYEAFLSEYHAFPVLTGDQIEYEDMLPKQEDWIHNIEPDISFNDLASAIEKTSEAVEITEKNNESTESNAHIIKMDEEERPIDEEPEIDLHHKALDSISIGDPNINVFDYFSECEQSQIISASPQESFFVDAGPGTGKTYTLIQKLNHLVCSENVEADGILVLCFTNAAVEEIKMRLRQYVLAGADRSLVNVDVRTFHSFAWWLINQANTVLTDEGWKSVKLQSLSYETSLVQASEIIRRFGDKVVGNWEYFIVDEVQDLTNTLGKFVLKIVESCISVRCGVTVLGDACQAIYDYNQETSYRMKSDKFYKGLFRKMYGNAKFVFLTENHRQGPELIKLTSGLRTAILSGDINEMNNAMSDFRDNVETSTASGAAITETFLNELRQGGSVSLLLRNNGQTLKLSSDLRKRGVEHTLNVSETGNNFAIWIADIFGSYQKPTISEDKFVDLFEDATGFDGEEVWKRLQRLLHTDNDVLIVKELLNAIAVSKIDDSILRTVREKKVIVSNIHRSKGREYDCVLVDKSFVDSFSAETPCDEYKTLYVAVTRPKKRLLLAPMQTRTDIRVIKIFSTGRSRWGNTKNKKISYLELDSAKDIGCDCFASVKTEVFDEIMMGDAVYLKRKINTQSVEYLIIHENSESIIGIIPMSSNYIQDLMGYMKISNKELIELPSIISDIYVSGIYSQVVDDDYLELHPSIKAFAPNGVWKWVDLVGLGHAEYDVY